MKQNDNNKKKVTKNSPESEEMVFSWSNYKWMLAGVALLVVGFALMWGGGSESAEVFDAEKIFAWRRIGLAPIVVLSGFGLVGYSIFHRTKSPKDK